MIRLATSLSRSAWLVGHRNRLLRAGVALGAALSLLGLGPRVIAATQTPLPTASVAGAIQTTPVALISLHDDPRYQARTLEHHYLGHPAGPLLAAAQLAAQDGRLALQARGLQLAIQDVRLATPQALDAALQKLVQADVRYWVLDLPAAMVRQSAQAARGKALVFNASARDDRLRGNDCAANLFHVIPSDAMLSDALAQYLAERNWRKALVLQGTTPADLALAQAWARSCCHPLASHWHGNVNPFPFR